MNLTNYTVQVGLSTIESSQPINVIVQSFTPLELFIICIGIYICVIFIHELGHLYALRSLNKNATLYVRMKGIIPNLEAGDEADYKAMTPQERIKVYMWGIVAGTIPIFLGMIINPAYMLLFLVYVKGILSDYDNIIADWKLIKSRQ